MNLIDTFTMSISRLGAMLIFAMTRKRMNVYQT